MWIIPEIATEDQKTVIGYLHGPIHELREVCHWITWLVCLQGQVQVKNLLQIFGENREKMKTVFLVK